MKTPLASFSLLVHVCSQNKQGAVLGMCLEMCIQPHQCCCSGLCQILSDTAMPVAKPMEMCV